jgi:hypothetical protein
LHPAAWLRRGFEYRWTPTGLLEVPGGRQTGKAGTDNGNPR